MAITKDSASAHPSTRHHRCDEGFLALLEEDYGIAQYSLRKAFYGAPAAPKKQAISLCEWAIWSAKGDVDEAGDALRAWARKTKAGAYSAHLVGAPPVEEGL